VDTPNDKGPVDIAAILLVLQAALGLVAGLDVLWIAAGQMPQATMLTVGVSVAGLVAAIGVATLHSWARWLVVALQGLLVLNEISTTLPRPAIGISLVAVLTNLVLPAAIIALLWSRSSRAAFARARSLSEATWR
jgi:hypothetical protein